MKQITSTNNQIIKQLKSLHQKKYRKQYDSFLIEGTRLIFDAIKNSIKIDTVLIHQDKLDKFSQIINSLNEDCAIYVVSDAIINSLCLTDSPEGIIAKVHIPSINTEDFNNKLVLVLDGVQDPGNLGTIIRTANSAGIRDIYLLGSNVDVYNPKVVRSAMGSIFFINFHQFNDADELYTHLKDHGYSICVTTLSNRSYYDISLPNKVALVMGNEGNGVSEKSISKADLLLTLPMDEKAESLNVAVCTGILIYDILHRR